MKFVLALCILPAIAADCVPTGAECTGGKACCLTTDKCESVNQYYQKCVVQPKCAKAGAQCAGKGDSVMEKIPCCDAGFVCNATNEWFSSCINASAPIPPPPPPTPKKNCSDTGAQCGGGAFSPLPCCDTESQCEVVNQFFSKCVDQPTCAADNALCAGSGDHTMKNTTCCHASNHTCVPWGDEWNVCRKAGEETCSAHGEQCAGSGGSSMKPKACCDPKDSCVVVNPYYSKCDSNATVTEELAPDSCPGLEKCPF